MYFGSEGCVLNIERCGVFVVFAPLSRRQMLCQDCLSVETDGRLYLSLSFSLPLRSVCLSVCLSEGNVKGLGRW